MSASPWDALWAFHSDVAQVLSAPQSARLTPFERDRLAVSLNTMPRTVREAFVVLYLDSQVHWERALVLAEGVLATPGDVEP